ncbi:protein DOWN-REGULATED IN DIF1 11-like [Primulina tabacum]|uniref:protein DOWN-REGULATED IN DIF1 11-like n=1 Tax=Primulina tabacum TaxID=48773 RepID=UPI003F5A9CB7
MEGFKLPSALAAFALVVFISAFFAAADPNTVTIDVNDLPAAAPVDEIRAEPYPGFYDLSRRCISKLTDECGKEVLSGLFNKENKVSQSCCVKLVAMGQECHIGLMKALLMFPDLTENDRNEILTIDNTIWSECLKVSN